MRSAISGFPGYEVDVAGRIWSRWKPLGKGRGWGICDDHCKLIKPNANSGKSNDRHTRVILYRAGRRFHRYVHRLVLETFVGPCPAGCECRHLDGNETNNRLDNLCWGTRQENSDDRQRHGTVPFGMDNGKTKLTTDNVRQIHNLRSKGLTHSKIAKLLNTPKSTISGILRGRTRSKELGIQHVGTR